MFVPVLLMGSQCSLLMCACVVGFRSREGPANHTATRTWEIASGLSFATRGMACSHTHTQAHTNTHVHICKQPSEVYIRRACCLTLAARCVSTCLTQLPNMYTPILGWDRCASVTLRVHGRISVFVSSNNT